MQQSGFKLDTGSQKTILEISPRGRLMLTNPVSNQGAAFTDAEREQLNLAGLPTNWAPSTEEQLQRTYGQSSRCPSPLSKFIYLSQLRDRNEVLYYRLVGEHLEEILPIAYTLTIGKAIERFSHEYVGTRGVFLSIDHPERIEESLYNFELTPENVDLVVVTDPEGILGIGDQGTGGIQIAIGRLGLYTAAAGIHPQRAIPVALDIGTDNLGLLHSDRYLGERHVRVRGEQYDEFVDRSVRVVTELFPNAMTYWKDLGVANAHRILQRHAKGICTFNNDIQGIAIVVLAAAIVVVRCTGVPLRRYRFVIYGAGTAGIGIADMIRGVLSAVGRDSGQFYAFNHNGLIIEDSPGTREFQKPYTRLRFEIDGQDVVDPHRVNLLETTQNAQSTILIGTSARDGVFSEEVVREMHSYCERPVIILPLNPTDRCEARPSNPPDWTDGKALIATGSPFESVRCSSIRHTIAQANNALIFPGLRLGVPVVQARLVSEEMIYATAQALAGLTSEHQPGASLLLTVRDPRMVVATVTKAVAETAESQDLTRRPPTNPIQDTYGCIWKPEYPELRIV